MTPLPDGLLYQPEFITVVEEQRMLEAIVRACFQPVRMHGVVARRRVVHYGLIYGYDSWSLTPGPPMPGFLTALKHRCAEWMGLPQEALEEALLTEYTPGATIGWHLDAAPFGIVIGVSLGGACRMRFRTGEGTLRRQAGIILESRSAYALTGPARSEWQHYIPAVKVLRYSVTFRTLRPKSRLEPSEHGASGLLPATPG